MKSVFRPASLFSILAMVAGMFILVLIFAQHKLIMHFLFNSDTFYLPALYIDLFRNGGSLSAWHLTPAPYFVPDWPIYFLSMGIFGQPYQATAAFFIAQIFLSFCLLVAINRQFMTTHHALAASACSVLFFCLLAARMVEPFSFILLSAYHYGAFLMLLLAAYCVISALQDTSAAHVNRCGATIFLVALLASLSDKLFLVQFSLPAIFVLVYLHAAGMTDRKTLIVLLSGTGGGSVLGPLLYKFLVPNSMSAPAELGLDNFSRNAHDLLAVVIRIAEANWFAMAVVALFYIAVTALPVLRRKTGETMFAHSSSFMFVVVFSLCSGFAIVAVALLNKMPFNSRYLIPVFALPVLFAPILIFGGFKSAPANWGGFAMLIVSVLSVIALTRAAVDGAVTPKKDFYPDDVACIDAAAAKYRLKNGIAEYWDAKRVAVLSKEGLNVAQVFGDLSPQRWIMSNAAFKGVYDFALINPDPRQPTQPDERRIVELNGLPKASIQCGAIKMLIYPVNGLATDRRSH